jgi:hypothetical protein
MARVDKTESAVGVIRGTLAADFAEAAYNIPVGVGINSSGLVVVGAGQSGIAGVVIPDRTAYKAGSRCDIFVLAEIVLDDDDTDLLAGTAYYVNNTTGAVTATSAGGTKIGFTIEADRLAVRM